MRAGGGQAKGAQFERTIGIELSLWISGGTRKDLLRRNILSGGRFTTGVAKGELHGVPGDLSISHPMAAAFCSTFLVECKHYADLNWNAFLYNQQGRKPSFLHQVIAGCRAQTLLTDLHWMVIAKQNSREPFVIMEYDVGMAANDAQTGDVPFNFHVFHAMEYVAIPFADLMTGVDPAQFIIAVEGLK